MSAWSVLRNTLFVLKMLDFLVETQVLLVLLRCHVREDVVLVTECNGVAWQRLGILLVDPGVGLVVALLPSLELCSRHDVLVELGQEAVEGRVLVSLLVLSLSASATWSGLDDSGNNKSESK